MNEKIYIATKKQVVERLEKLKLSDNKTIYMVEHLWFDLSVKRKVGRAEILLKYVKKLPGEKTGDWFNLYEIEYKKIIFEKEANDNV